jgi:hypothetical protein
MTKGHLMISIRIGNTALLKAELLSTDQNGSAVYRDLMMGIDIKDDLTLAAMMDEDIVEFIHDAHMVWLNVSGGPILRRLKLGVVEDDDQTAIMLTDEMNSTFDIHDITLAHLMQIPS